VEKDTLSSVLRWGALAIVVAALLGWLPGGFFSGGGNLKSIKNRKPMATFELPSTDGTRFNFRDYRGHVVLINFWATWCSPCRAETPELVDLHNRYLSRGFTVVGISMDENAAEVVPDFITEYKMTYPVLLPTKDFLFADHIDALPTSLLIDREGRIAQMFVGRIPGAALARSIESLLEESSPEQAVSREGKGNS
jgi:peroxiredoxin